MWMNGGLCTFLSEDIHSLFKMFGLVPLCYYQHGGEGRLSNMFSNAMQPIVSEDLRSCFFLSSFLFLCFWFGMWLRFMQRL